MKRLHDAGIPVAVGTDAGMPGTFHGYSTLRELQLLVLAGLTPLEAIAAGTSVSARALAVDGQRGTIAPGKLADLVLVEGRPDERIDDVFQTRRVFLGGSELSPADLEKAIQSTELTPLPVQRMARALIDDMERGDGRTEIDTLRVNSTDSGADHSAMLMLPVARAEGGHALLVAAQMADKGHPYVRVEFPLTAGAIYACRPERVHGRLIRRARRGEGPVTVAVVPRARSGCLCRSLQSEREVADGANSVRGAASWLGEGSAVGWQGRPRTALRTGRNGRFQCLGGIGQCAAL